MPSHGIFELPLPVKSFCHKLITYPFLFVLQGDSPTVSTQTTTGSDGQALSTVTTVSRLGETPKRLHVSNIPFKFRDPDLRQLFGVSHKRPSVRKFIVKTKKCMLFSQLTQNNLDWSVYYDKKPGCPHPKLCHEISVKNLVHWDLWHYITQIEYGRCIRVGQLPLFSCTCGRIILCGGDMSGTCSVRYVHRAMKK